jgi:predicted nucleic acid-binding protein
LECVDASVFLAWLLPEDLSDQAEAFFARAGREGAELIAPALVTAEVLSGLRRAVYRKRVTSEDGDEARSTFREVALQLHDLSWLSDRAWSLGSDINAPSLHDMFYLALAERENCELWTADKRLLNLLDNRYPRVRFIGEVETESDDEQPA